MCLRIWTFALDTCTNYWRTSSCGKNKKAFCYTILNLNGLIKSMDGTNDTAWSWSIESTIILGYFTPCKSMDGTNDTALSWSIESTIIFGYLTPCKSKIQIWDQVSQISRNVR